MRDTRDTARRVVAAWYGKDPTDKRFHAHLEKQASAVIEACALLLEEDRRELTSEVERLRKAICPDGSIVDVAELEQVAAEMNIKEQAVIDMAGDDEKHHETETRLRAENAALVKALDWYAERKAGRMLFGDGYAVAYYRLNDMDEVAPSRAALAAAGKEGV